MIYTQNGSTSYGKHIGTPMPKSHKFLNLDMVDILTIIEKKYPGYATSAQPDKMTNAFTYYPATRINT